MIDALAYHKKWLSGLILVCCPFLAGGQLKLLPEETTTTVFGGEPRTIRVVFHNPGTQLVEANLQTRLSQASSATTIPLGDTPWKKLVVLPGQTVLETATLRFPSVHSGTRFLVQWMDEGRRVIGATEVMVYPTGLLKELRLLSGEKPLGVFDPANQLKPLLREAKVEFENLEENGWEGFTGKLAIVGPFAAKEPRRASLTQAITERVKRGLAVVWIQPQGGSPTFQPSFYPVRVGEGAILVCQASLVQNLTGSPTAQQNLLQLARLAVNPEPFTFPQPNP